MVSTHSVLEINQHDVIDWLSEAEVSSPVLIERQKQLNLNNLKGGRRDLVEKLNPKVMEYIAREMLNYIVEIGAYDDALNFVAESGFLDGVFRK
ncbi:MAG: hypothetical protein FWC41_11530 [Firmicutes bacterium]|nr:hypothetical protein [Bacillota bacterium]